MGAGGKENAAACAEQAAAESTSGIERYRSRFFRGSAEPVYRFLLYSAQYGNPPSGALRRLLHHGPEFAAVRHDRGRRVCRSRCRHDLQPFCRLRAAVPLSSGLRRTADAHCPVDRHRLRRRAGHVPARPDPSGICHRGHRPGSGHHGRKQHGRCHGPR